jgi:hypothetical protein
LGDKGSYEIKELNETAQLEMNEAFKVYKLEGIDCKDIHENFKIISKRRMS